jgi:hypothetical protein
MKSTDTIYVLQAIETAEYIVLRCDGTTWLVSFSDPEVAYEFSKSIGTQEFNNIVAASVDSVPFTHFWIDGKFCELDHG